MGVRSYKNQGLFSPEHLFARALKKYHISVMSRSATRILYTIAASQYCEKARWSLELASIPFKESAHAPLATYFYTKPLGGRSVPLLTGLDGSPPLTDSRDIMGECAKKATWLYPNEESKSLEIYFNDKFGPQVRRCAYYQAFQNDLVAKQVIIKPTENVIERSLSALAYPLIKATILKSLNINAITAEKSIERIDKVFDQVEEKLGDKELGSTYLAGKSFSAADLTFASMASLIILPKECTTLDALLKLEDLPAISDKIKQWRERKAGKFVQYCYTHHRLPKTSTSKTTTNPTTKEKTL